MTLFAFRIFTEIFVAKPEVNIHSKIQSLFYNPFVPVHPALASIFNITTALHAEFLTAFVHSHFFLICTKSTATSTYHGNFALVVSFSGRRFQNMPWQIKKFVSSRVSKLLRFRAAIFPAFANEVHLLTRFFEKVGPQLPSSLMILIKQPLKKKNSCKLIKNRTHPAVIIAQRSKNDFVRMKFPENSSPQCFRTAPLSMVTPTTESRNPMDCLYIENHSKP